MISLNTFLVIAVFALVLLVIVCIVFQQTLKQIEGLSLENCNSAWEVFAKVITIVTATVAGLLAFIRYADQRELELSASKLAAAQSVREFNISIYGEAKTTAEAKRVLLNEAADLVSTLATLEDLDSPMGQITLNRFERLYHGQLILYENKAVESAMVRFRNALLEWQHTGVRPEENIPTDACDSEGLGERERNNTDYLRQLAIALSNACRLELDCLDRKKTCDVKQDTPNAEGKPKPGKHHESQLIGPRFL